MLKRIKQVYGDSIEIGGSDLSRNAIERIRQTFPSEKLNFHVLSMTEKHQFLGDNSKDHVLSFGAIGMYLYEDEMEAALFEALRIVKPGGHLCFTHFVEPGGLVGSILEPLKKSQWVSWAKKYSLQKLVIKTMIHQGDRYFVCFSKRL